MYLILPESIRKELHMNVLVTGTDGFIGKNISEYLEIKGYSVWKPNYMELDLLESKRVREYCATHLIDAVVHSATTSIVNKKYPEDVCERNLRMFFNIIDSVPRDAKVINLNSGSVYSRKHWEPQMKEEYFSSHIPEDGHSYSKYVISKYIQTQSNVDMVDLMLFGIFGKYEDYCYKFISNTIVKNIGNIPIIINRNAVYDYIYILDFCRIIEFFLCNKARHRSYNITPTHSIDLYSIAKLVNQVGKNQSEIKVMVDGFGREYTGDNTRLMEEITDFSFMSYEQSIADLYNYYDNHKSKINFDMVRKDPFLEYAKKLNEGYGR